MAGVLLDVLRQASEEGGGLVPASIFSCPALSETVDLQAEYLAWMQGNQGGAHALTSLLQMPYMFTTEAKARLLHHEAATQQHHHMSAHAMQASSFSFLFFLPCRLSVLVSKMSTVFALNIFAGD